MHRPEETRQRLISAAGPLFARKGFAAVSIREICQAAQVNIAAIHYHFGDKEGLYRACLQESQSLDMLRDVVQGMPPDTPAAEKLTHFIAALLAGGYPKARQRWHLELFLREMAEPTATCRDLVIHQARPLAEFVWELLTELAPQWSRDNPTHWRIVFSIVGQVLFYHLHQPLITWLLGEEGSRQLDPQLISRHIAQFCLAALGQAPPLCDPDSPRASELPSEFTVTCCSRSAMTHHTPVAQRGETQ